MAGEGASTSGAEFALLLSKWYFHAFPLEEDRARHWLLIYYLVRENKPRITKKRLNTILVKTPFSKDYALMDKLLKYLHIHQLLSITDKDGARLPAEEEDLQRHRIRTSHNIELTETFYGAIRDYVSRVFADMGLSRNQNLNKEQLASITYELYRFQVDRVNGAWRHFVNELATSIGIEDPPAFERAIVDSSEAWFITHLMWLRSFELEPRRSKMSVAQLTHAIIENTGAFVRDADIRVVLDHLTEGPEGRSILVIDRRGKENVYFLNDAKRPIFAAHEQHMTALAGDFGEVLRQKASAVASEVDQNARDPHFEATGQP